MHRSRPDDLIVGTRKSPRHFPEGGGDRGHGDP